MVDGNGWKPGPDLDLMVATEIMGHVAAYLSDDGNLCVIGDNHGVARLFHPSRDLQDALRVLQRMKMAGYRISIDVEPDDTDATSDLCLSICLAALNAANGRGLGH